MIDDGFLDVFGDLFLLFLLGCFEDSFWFLLVSSSKFGVFRQINWLGVNFAVILFSGTCLFDGLIFCLVELIFGSVSHKLLSGTRFFAFEGLVVFQEVEFIDKGDSS